MHSLFVQAAAVIAAAGPSSPPFLQGDNFKAILIFAAGILGGFVGLIIINNSRKGNLRKNFEMTGGVFLGFVVMAGSLGMAFWAFGDKFIGYFLN